MTADLVLRAQAGDGDAFDALIRAAYDRLFAAAYRIVREREGAEDAVQDAVVRCWRNLRGLRQPDRFEAWLYRLLVNACRDQSRRARRRPVEVSDEALDPASPSDVYASLAEHDALERAFLTLSADHRIALVLVHYVGYSAPEAAAILGVPIGTVYSRIHYGARAMREALAPSASVRPAATESTR
ncbi:MAG TPA: RNA polymerase sigma factor [Candidatus Limnocylindria bacterium]